LSVAPSLRKLEQSIVEDLKKEKLQVYFKIKNYDTKTGAIEHDVAPTDPKSRVPKKAWTIINRHIGEWRKFPRCPTCLEVLGKHSTYVDKEQGEIIHRDCGGIVEDKLPTSHRGITKGRSR